MIYPGTVASYARTGSMIATATELGVNRSTVCRRLAAAGVQPHPVGLKRALRPVVVAAPSAPRRFSWDTGATSDQRRAA